MSDERSESLTWGVCAPKRTTPAGNEHHLHRYRAQSDVLERVKHDSKTVAAPARSDKGKGGLKKGMKQTDVEVRRLGWLIDAEM